MPQCLPPVTRLGEQLKVYRARAVENVFQLLTDPWYIFSSLSGGTFGCPPRRQNVDSVVIAIAVTIKVSRPPFLNAVTKNQRLGLVAASNMHRCERGTAVRAEFPRVY